MTETLTAETSLTVARKPLLDALRQLAPAVARKGATPAFRCVRVRAHAGRLTVQTATAGLSGRTSIPVDGEVSLDALVEHKALVEGLRSLTCEDVSLAGHECGLRVLNGVRQLSIPAGPIAQFPDWKPQLGTLALTANAKDFACQIARVATHAANDQTRPVLTGMYFDADKHVLVATDSYRLLCSYPRFEWATNQPFLLAAADLAAIVRKWGRRPQGQVALHVSEGHATLVYGDQHWQLHLIDGTYPNYRQLCPDQDTFTAEARVEAQTLADVSRAAAKLAQRNRPLRLTVAAESIAALVTCDDADSPLLAETLPAETRELRPSKYGYDPLPMDAGFNPAFLADAAAVLGDGEIRLRLISPVRPMFIDAPTHTADWALLMPIRLNV